MADIEIETVPRLAGWSLVVIAVVSGFAVVVGAWWLVDTAGLFEAVSIDSEVTYADKTSSSTSVDSTAFGTAQWATVALMLVGALLIVCGFVLALADLTKTKATVPGVIPDDVNGNAEGYELAAADVGAILGSVAELSKALAGALKDLKASTALLVIGATLMIFGGMVAWQTAPDRSSAPTSTSGTTTTAPVASVPSSSLNAATTVSPPPAP